MNTKIPNYIVFCDFDGTITNFETAEGLWEYYLGDDFKRIAADMVQRGVNLSEAVKYLFGQIPSSRYNEMTAFLETMEMRDGFVEFLDYLDSQHIPIVIISGGIGEMIQHLLKPYLSRFAGCHFCNLSTDQEFLTISSPYDDGVDLIRKELVMKEYPHETSIFFGDSYTDRNPAQVSDIVFARDRLDAFLTDLGKDHFTFETFFDAIQVFKEKGFTNL
ncbi:MAG: HAD-IB family phosphatase [Lachnospiraceae bacterium]